MLWDQYKKNGLSHDGTIQNEINESALSHDGTMLRSKEDINFALHSNLPLQEIAEKLGRTKKAVNSYRVRKRAKKRDLEEEL